MNEDLKQAVERLRKVKSGELIDSVYATISGHGEQAIRDFEKDTELAADAFLKEHPPDEPITAEWLESVGFQMHDPPEISPWVKLLTIGDLAVDRSNDCNHWTMTNGGTAVIATSPETRSDVRRLCNALGITLEEPNR